VTGTPDAPRYAAVVLAAGSATRFGSDKLSAIYRGEPLLSHAIAAARAAPVERVLVVARPGLGIGEWMGAPPVETVPIESQALSESLKAGIAAAAEVDGAFIFLGDMPLVPHDIASELASRIGDAYAAMPRQGGKPGHPVLLSARAFADIAGLTGDEGAGRLLRKRDDVVFDECTNSGIHRDVDRPEDLGDLP